MRQLTEEQIDEKVTRFVEHMDRMLSAGQVTVKTYQSALEDIVLWARARRLLIKQASHGAVT